MFYEEVLLPGPSLQHSCFFGSLFAGLSAVHLCWPSLLAFLLFIFAGCFLRAFLLASLLSFLLGFSALLAFLAAILLAFVLCAACFGCSFPPPV